MKQLYFLIFILISLCNSVFAQPTEEILLGTEIAGGYVPNGSYGPKPIGFSFFFYGNSYDNFYVNTKGQVLFGPDPIDTVDVSIPSTGTPNNFIAAFWDHTVISSSGNILYTTQGLAPNRKLIIQFRNIGFYPFPVFMGSYSVILYETSNIIKIQYRQIVDNSSTKAHGKSATIGIENSDGSAGVLYAYHNPTAITTSQAITFTPTPPNGTNYSLNSNALYEAVYLTKNLTFPEPGIPTLISPQQNVSVGANVTFQWSNSTYASSVILKISKFSNLTSATNYIVGTNLTLDVTGLDLNTTYYWGVFSSNATGNTWSEIKRFNTTTVPPVTPISQTIWAEQFQDKTIGLLYTGGDVTAKTAVITSLPIDGQLYQYSAGSRGLAISSVPTTVTDAGRNVIYSASGISGNGVGNFTFHINDIHGDSPEGSINLNVSPPGVPDVLFIAKNSNIEIQFDIPMADPTGKQAQFTVIVNGSPVAVTSVSLKPGDPNTIILNLGTSLLGSESVNVSYTQGTVTGSTGGFLFSFTAQPVTLLAQTISFITFLNKKYGDPAFALSATSTLPGITFSSSNLSVATITGSTLTINGVGTSDISVRQAGNATYAPARYIKTLTVVKGDQTITFNPIPVKVYGFSDYTPTLSSSSGLPVSLSSNNTSVGSISGGSIQITGAGIALITATQAGNSLWNAAVPFQQTLTVNKASLTVTPDAQTKIKGAANPPLTYGYSGWVHGVETIDTPPTATTTVNLASPVGFYAGAITVAGGTDNNYVFTYLTGDFTVTKANQTITFDALTAKSYGDNDFSPFATSSSGLPVTFTSNNSSVAVIAGGMISITGAGTATITASQAGNAEYNAALDVQQTLTVNKASLSVTPDAQTKIYGAANPALTYVYSGWVNGVETIDTPPTTTTTINFTSPAGSYATAITVSGGLDNNYNFTFLTSDFTITKTMLTVTADPKSKVYGAANPLLTITYSGWRNNDSESVFTTIPVVSTIVGPTTPIGLYTGAITVSGGTAYNYDFTYIAGNFTVTKGNQTITFNALPAKIYGDADFSPVATASSGLPVSFTSSNNSVALIVGGMIRIIGAGTASITASQSGNADYNAAPDVPQTLTVSKASQTITFSDVPTELLVGDNYTLLATSTSGLTISFESSDRDLATIDVVQLTGVSRGEVLIRAYHAGNLNYEASEIFVTIEINSTHDDIMYLYTPNGDGFNDYWELPDLEVWGKCDVKIYNRWGALVFADADYNNLWDGTSEGSLVPEGAYYFIIKTENSGTIKGTVNVVR